MVGAARRLCWHDLNGTTVELAIEMHRQRKRAEAQGKTQAVSEAALQEEEDARTTFEQQRDVWVWERAEEDTYNIDNAHSWMLGNLDAG